MAITSAFELIELGTAEAGASNGAPNGAQRDSAPPVDGPLLEVALGMCAARLAEVSAACESTTATIRQQAEHLSSTSSGQNQELVGSLVSSLATRCDALGREADELEQILGRAAALLGSKPNANAYRRAAANGNRNGKPEPAPASDVSPASVSDLRSAESTSSPGMHLLAVQMWLAGSDKDEIRTCLREQFGIEDADSVINHAIGSAKRR